MLISGLEVFIAIVVMVVGGLVMGLVSIGIGMVVSPVLLLLIDPQSAVMTINSIAIPILALVLLKTRHDIPMRSAIPLPVAGLLAVPIGVLILSSASPGVLRPIIGCIILCLAIPSAFRIERPLPHANILTPVFGFLGSLLVTGTGIGPPLVALFLLNQGWAGRAIRGSIALYYLPIAALATVLYAVTGLFTLERVWLILALTPAGVLGFGMASLLVKRMNDEFLRRVILAVVVAASIALLGREAVRLLQ